MFVELAREGGWTGTLPADETVQQIAQQVTHYIVQLLHDGSYHGCYSSCIIMWLFQVIGQVAFYDYKAVSYRSQVVAGVNYIIKVTCCYSNVI